MILDFNTDFTTFKITLPPRIAFDVKFICNVLRRTKLVKLAATSSGTKFMRLTATASLHTSQQK